MVGLLLPVLPTTPFLLLAVACFSTSPRLKANIMKVKLFREYVENYQNRTGLPHKTVILSLCYLWSMLLLSMFLVQTIWIICLLSLVGVSVTIHILYMAKGKGEGGLKTKRVFGIVEAAFNILYLVIALLLGFLLLLTGAKSDARILAGIMTFVLAFGDAFHLLPRIKVTITREEEPMQRALGRGKQVASITMTVFYVLLWQIGLLALHPRGVNFWCSFVYFLAAVRIFLCLLPANGWEQRYPPVRWGIFRNIPFFLLGMVVAGLYVVQRDPLPGLAWMWLAILLSFAFYLPVVLFANRDPKVGILMLPKACAYLWILIICHQFL